jgi:type IV secretion system protein VirD4
MIYKKKIPFSFYIILLIPILLLSFVLSGIFSFSDLSFANYQQKLKFVFEHFYQPQIWINDKTVPCMGIGLTVWIFLVSYISYHFRNFQHDLEYGSAEWGDPASITKKRSDPVLKNNRIFTRNLRIMTKGTEALSNNNMMVIGTSGTYKTTSIVTPNLLRCACNYIVLDVKGELMFKYGLYLKSQGYTIRCLNLKYPDRSERYNPFEYIEKEEDIINLIENIYDSLTPSESLSNDPFWEEGPRLFLQSLFFLEWFMSKKENRKGNFNNVMKYLNMESQPDKTKKVEKGKMQPSKLQSLIESLSDEMGTDNMAYTNYMKFKAGAAETVRSIIIIINAKFKLCEIQGVRYIFSDDDMHLRDFATGVGGSIKKPSNKKVALFLCTDDMDSSFNFICSMLYTQAITILARMADDDFKATYGGELPIPLEIWMDEFYAGARPSHIDGLLGVIRSRNISLIPILQSISQIKSLYKEDKWGIILDNIPTTVFLGAGPTSLDTLKYMSDLLGNATIDMSSDGKSGKQYSSNFQKVGRALMTPQEISEMDKHYAIVYTQAEKPVYDRKALPWEDKKKDSPFSIAMRMNKRSKNKGYIHPVTTKVDENGNLFRVEKRKYNNEKYGNLPVLTDKPSYYIEDYLKLSNTEFLGMNLRRESTDKAKVNQRLTKMSEAMAYFRQNQ